MKPPRNATMAIGVVACLAIVTGLLLPGLFTSQPPAEAAKGGGGQKKTPPGRTAQEQAVADTSHGISVSGAATPGLPSAEIERADVVIQKLLEANPTVETASKSLLEGYPGFKPAEKVAAAPHIAGLLPDDQAQTLVELLTSPDSPNQAKEIFYNNLLNRPHPIAWPMLVEVIAIPNHPLAERAKEMLMAVVGQDLGSSVEAWRQEVAKQLRPLE